MIGKTLSSLAFVALSPCASAQCFESFYSPTAATTDFAHQLAADGDRFVAADKNPDRVSVHELVPGGASELATLAAPAGSGAEFGSALALQGGTLIVGQRGATLAAADAGAVHVYEESGGVFTLIQTLLPVAPSGGEGFGTLVALDGERLAVSAPGEGGGVVYVYRRSGAQWLQEALITNATPLFGHALALQGDVLAVSSPVGQTLAFAGTVFVYERLATGWTQAALLESSAPVSPGRFGEALALDGGVLAIGEPWASGPESGSGRVALHDRALGWARVAEVVPNNVVPQEGFGGAVALRDGRLRGVASAHVARGAVWTFESGAAGWAQRSYDMPLPGDWVAAPVALAGSADLYSGRDDGAGGVWILDPDAPPLGSAYCEVAPNSSGAAGELFYRWTTSAAAQDLTLLTRGLIPGESVLLFYGPAAQQAPLGDGWLCVAGPWNRLPAGTVGVVGKYGQALPWTQAPVSSGPGAITAGSTWFFQAWYRDPGGVGGSNLTNGLALTFCP